MAQGPQGHWTDERVDQALGNLLRAGVVLAGLVILAGGILYLVRHGEEKADHKLFHGEPAELRSPVGVVQEAQHLRARAIIQLGLLLLIATPVARVVCSVIAFALQRDRLYILLTLVVLAVLLYSLFAANP
jgi:uncharacterized membrane protein